MVKNFPLKYIVDNKFNTGSFTTQTSILFKLNNILYKDKSMNVYQSWMYKIKS